MKRYEMGDSCMVWSLGTDIGLSTSTHVLQAYRQSKQMLDGEPGFRDMVPSYTDLALYYDPLEADVHDLVNRVESVIRRSSTAGHFVGKAVRFGVVYSGEDLGRVGRLSGLTSKQVVQRHTSMTYTVAMIGFLPHFPYLIGLDPGLSTPRLESPRKNVPAGAVAIGGAQTGIYPVNSPGGWNIIGMTDTELLHTLEPGDRVFFEEVEAL